MKYIVTGALLLLLLAVSTVSAAYAGNFCNVFEAGSSFSGKSVSMTTIAGDRFVGSGVLKPVTTSYSADIAGIGTATSFMRGTMQGASKSVSFSQQTTASGTIMKYFIEYHWSSGRS
ncbi:MAG: hypothetical protein QMC82_03120 [Methanolinea sp.]|nr:hypothetical protein [Methanolinea sp.]